ncbi:MAG: PEGA domain-containing protein, partial [Proteobacteria bacterium]|nr:PEGA domain-containing protein [Pseudomonadota bacterium]
KAMMRLEPHQRPSAREVEDHALLLRSRVEGPTLRNWAEEMVPEAVTMTGDDLVGTVLTETLANVPRTNDLLAKVKELDELEGETNPNNAQSIKVGTIINLIAIPLVITLSVVSAVVVTQWYARSNQAPIQEIPSLSEVRGTPGKPPPVVELSQPEPDAEAKADPVKPAVKSPATHPKSEPVVAPPPPTPEPKDAAPEKQVPLYEVTFSSIPLGAEVWVDGTSIGRTIKRNYEMPQGEHTVRMTSSAGSIEQVIVVGRRRPNTYIWRGGDKWEGRSN